MRGNRGVFRSGKLFSFIAIGLIGTGVVFQLINLFRTEDERGRFTTDLLKQQLAQLHQWTAPRTLIASQQGWPDDFLALQQWLIGSALKGEDPSAIARNLEALSRDRSFSTTMDTSIARWRDSLERWGRFRTQYLDEAALPEVFLNEGRLRHYEATGYQKIGRMYDGTTLYLWSTEALREFIERWPTHPAVPEAVFLIGKAFMKLQHALPPGFKSDLILNMCTQLYPQSVWSRRARFFRQQEIGRNA